MSDQLRPSPEEVRARVIQKREDRLKLMALIYEASDGRINRILEVFKIADFLGMDRKYAEDMVTYLEGESLVRVAGTSGFVGSSIAITHIGAVEVETAMVFPDQPTSHFAPYSVTYHTTIGHADNLMLQQNSPGATQSMNFGPQQQAQLREVLDAVKASLPTAGLSIEQREEADLSIKLVESQLKKPDTDWKFVVNLASQVAGILAFATSPVVLELGTQLMQIAAR